MEVQRITKESMQRLMSDLLSLEHNWTEIGDTAWTRENFEKDLPGKWDLSSCIYYDGKIIGYLIGSIDGNVGKLNKILVDSSFRGKGFADMLWKEFLNDCKKKNLERAEFKVLTDNKAAINFYRKNGCLFDGDSLGSDGLMRHNIVYPFSLKERIHHSKPTVDSDDRDAVIRAIENGDLATGKIVDNLVQTLSGYIGRKYGVATSSGSAALHLALRALDVKDGDEVILPSFVCNSVLNAVKYCNATPVLVDINPDDYNISYEDAKKKVSKKTKAIIVPHMFGKPVRNIEDFVSFGIPIVEDCALSVGASHNGKKVGSFGTLSVFSFRATKMLAAGLGGMVLTDDESLFGRLKDLTAYDNREKAGESYNYQMSDINAALALNQLKKLDGFVLSRRNVAAKYSEMFKKAVVDFGFPEIDEENIFFRYIIRHPQCDEFMKLVKARGIDVARPVFKPLHYYFNIPDNKFPNTAEAYNTAVSIPIYPLLDPIIDNETVQNVAGTLVNWKFESKSGV